jgi:hypothetical protein
MVSDIGLASLRQAHASRCSVSQGRNGHEYRQLVATQPEQARVAKHRSFKFGAERRPPCMVSTAYDQVSLCSTVGRYAAVCRYW